MDYTLTQLLGCRRSWGVRVSRYSGPWLSLGLHVDLAPSLDLHVLWWTISAGRLRESERGDGEQWP